MSEDNLGDFASLLGESFSQAAQSSESDRRRAEKRAMKDKLLYAFAAPLVSAAGKGIVDFAGDVVLGSNSKDFFSSREGASFKRRLNDVKRPLAELQSTADFLIKNSDGPLMPGTIEGGILNLTRQERIQEREDSFKGLPSYSRAVSEGAFKLSEEDIEQAKVEANELRSFIRDFSRATELTDSELLSRYRQTDIGKGRGRKLALKAKSFLLREDFNEEYVEPSVQFMLTGGDSSLQDTEFYRLMRTNKDFESQLQEAVTRAKDLGLSQVQTIDNTFEQLLANNPEIGGQLKSEYYAKREVAMEGAHLSEIAQDNPIVASAIQEAKKQGVPVTNRSISMILLDDIQGIENTEESSQRFMLSSSNAPIINRLRDDLAKLNFSRPFNEVTSADNISSINSQVKTFIKQATEQFNIDLLTVTEELKEDGTYAKSARNFGRAGKERLASLYLSTMLDPEGPYLPSTLREIPSASWMQKLTGGDEVDMMDGAIDLANEDLRNIIRGAFQNQQQQRQLEREALDDGTSTRLKTRKSPTSGTTVFSPNIRVVKNAQGLTLEEALEDISTDLTKTKFDRDAAIRLALDQLDERIQETFESSGAQRIDSLYQQDLEYLRNKFIK